MQKVCVVGAGAVGGVIGARLALAGQAVSAVARNETLASLRTHGWLLTSPDGERRAAPVAVATDDPAALGPHDVVILARVRRLVDTARPSTGRRGGTGSRASIEGMTVIDVRGLRKAYGGREAVAGIDLQVAGGEVFALLGPNGAGKTTTVEILEGHRRRDGGQVAVLGVDPGTAGRHWRARIGIVLQTATDAAELTVDEMVRHVAGFYRRPRPAAEVIDMVGLTAKAGSRIRTLSGGQRRRLDVALGVVGRPEVLFLDEPTTGFDPEARRQFWELIRAEAAHGTTILLTTHYLDEAEALADRLAVIADGRIVAEDTPAGLGGRATAQATVTWTGGTEYTADPTALIEHLVSMGADLSTLSVTRPTLEDMYLSLIGDKR